jgi:hypothetical protein
VELARRWLLPQPKPDGEPADEAAKGDKS